LTCRQLGVIAGTRTHLSKDKLIAKILTDMNR
jgi:hypothetical protein